MITNTKVFPNHLDRDVSRIFFDEYTDYPSQYDKIAKIESAPAGNHYTEAALSPLGALRKIDEGAGVTFDFPVEGNKVTRYYTKFGLGFQITEEMMEDDLTGNFRQMPNKLAKSAAIKREVEFWDLFNDGFTDGGDALAWDGEPIFANSNDAEEGHVTLKSGDIVNNEPNTASSLSETSLQVGFEYFDGLDPDGGSNSGAIDDAGNPIVMAPRYLIVHPKNRWMANRLMSQTFNVSSANRDLLSTNPGNNMVDPYQIIISRWLTSEDAWFFLSDEHDFRFYWKKQAGIESQDDFFTGNALFKVIMRFATFCNNPIGAYGNAGS
jgi:hypothetical protein